MWQKHVHFFYAILAFEAVSILDLLLTVLEMLSQGRTLACLALFSQLWQSLETWPSLRTPAESPTEEHTSSGSSSSSSSAGVSGDSACSSELAATCFSASADLSSSAWTVVKIDEKKSAMAIIVKQTSGGRGSRKSSLCHGSSRNPCHVETPKLPNDQRLNVERIKSASPQG